MQIFFRTLFFACVTTLILSLPALAQTDRQSTFSRVTSIGDVLKETTPQTGKIHVHGGMALSSADYFRGVLDGVPEDGDWSFLPSLGMTAELGDFTGIGMDMNLTVGMENGFSDDDPYDGVGSPELWYAADPYAGLSARLQNGLLVGLTYSVYTAPNDIFGSTQELALAADYAGTDIIGAFQPQLKVALPVNNGSGIFLQAKIKPDLNELTGIQLPVRTFVPVEFGVGLNEYYEDELNMYASVGLAASMPLNFEDYGTWSFDAGLNFLMRQDDLESMGEPYDSADNTVLMATVGVSFVY